MSTYLFTSESVSEGHPDKLADQISDAVLDAILAQDKSARVACETMDKTGVAIVAGEITTGAWADLESLVRKVIVDVGYNSISIIPGGTTNMTAFDLGIHDKPNLILERLKQHLNQSTNNSVLKTINKAVMRIEQTSQPTLYGMFLGLGLIARGVKFSRSRIKQIGITGNIFTTIIVLRSLIGTFLGRPHPTWAPVQIMLPHTNEANRSQPYLLAMISTLYRILMGIHPYWGQEKAPLHTTFVKQHCTRFWFAMLKIILKQGRSLKKEHGYLSYNTESLELLLDDEYIVDGELFHASSQQGPLKISAKEMVKFLIL